MLRHLQNPSRGICGRSQAKANVGAKSRPLQTSTCENYPRSYLATCERWSVFDLVPWYDFVLGTIIKKCRDRELPRRNRMLSCCSGVSFSKNGPGVPGRTWRSFSFLGQVCSTQGSAVHRMITTRGTAEMLQIHLLWVLEAHAD